MRDRGYVVDTSTTQDVAPRERTEYWDALVNTLHCRSSNEFARRDDFRGYVQRQRTSRFQLVCWGAEQAVYRRTPRDIGREADENYRLLIPISDKLFLRQEGVATSLPPGAAAVALLSQPFEARHERPVHSVVLTFPQHELDQRLDHPLRTAQPLDVNAGLGHVIANLVLGLWRQRDALNEWHFDAACERTVDLLGMLLLGDVGPCADYATDVVISVRQFVRANAGDPNLTGQSVAHALGWSLRHLQRCLQQVGTSPSALIKEEHLTAAHERLRSPIFQSCSITEIAHQLGFNSPSAFSTAFRGKFGVCPREVRAGTPRAGAAVERAGADIGPA